MHLSYTSVSLYRRCPQAYRYSYIDKMTLYPRAYQLDFGGLWHKLMAAYYLCPEPRDMEHLCAVVWKTEYEKAQQEQAAIGADLADLEERWTTLRKRLFTAAKNYQPLVCEVLWAERTYTHTLNSTTLVGIPDLCARWQGKQWLVEFKTASKPDPARYLIDDQSAWYCYLVPEVEGTLYQVLDTANLKDLHVLPMIRTEAEREDCYQRMLDTQFCITEATTYPAYPAWDCHIHCDYSDPCVAERQGYALNWADYPKYVRKEER